MIPEKNVAYLQEAVDNDVQTAYMRFLDYSDNLLSVDTDAFSKISELNKRTGVKPRHFGKIVQKAYTRLFEFNMPVEILYVYEHTKIRPKNINNNKAQKLYRNCLQRSFLEEIGKIGQITGIKPEITDENIQEAYEKCFSDQCSTKSIISFMAERLGDFTGKKPNEETVQKLYKVLFEREVKRDISLQNFEVPRLLMEFSGIGPKPKLIKMLQPTKRKLEMYLGIE